MLRRDGVSVGRTVRSVPSLSKNTEGPPLTDQHSIGPRHGAGGAIPEGNLSIRGRLVFGLDK